MENSNNTQQEKKEVKKDLSEFYEESFRELAEGEIVKGENTNYS